MAYLLDSNLVIPYLADEPVTVPLVERLAPEDIAISIVTYMEVFQGTLRSPDPERAAEQFEHFLAVVPILLFSPAVARRCTSAIVTTSRGVCSIPYPAPSPAT